MKTLETLTHPLRHLRLPILSTIAAGLVTFGAGTASGQHFGSAFRVGSTGNDEGMDIARDKQGNILVTGFFMGTVDFDPGSGVTDLTSAGSYDAFVAKYDHDHKLLWAKRMGGTDTDFAHALALDAAGNAVVTGNFRGTGDFDPGAATFPLTSAGVDDSFVCKLDGNGNFLWAKRLGGTGNHAARGIAVDASGNVLSIGEFTGTADFDPGAASFNLTAATENDIYISKLTSNGLFVWAKRLGGSGNDQGYSIAVDAAGNVLSTGTFSNTGDFDPGAMTFNLTASSNDIFVSKLNSSGNFVWAKRFGANGFDEGNDIAVDAAGNVFTTGTFLGTADFDPGATVFNLTSSGSFLSVLSSSGNFVMAKSFGGESKSLALDSLGNILLTGSFDGTADMDPGAPVFNLVSVGDDDIFVSKLDASGNFQWAGRLGGASQDMGYGIATDGVSANVWTTGMFGATGDFNPGPGVFNLTNAGEEGIFEMFVSRLTTHSKVLWSDEEGNAVLMTVDGCGDKVDSKGYGPVKGYIATSYDRSGEGGTGRILWSDSVNGKALLWVLDANDNVSAENTMGVGAGWKAASYRTSPDGSGKILWEHANGSRQFWTVDGMGNFVCGTELGEAPGWSVRTFCR